MENKLVIEVMDDEKEKVSITIKGGSIRESFVMME